MSHSFALHWRSLVSSVLVATAPLVSACGSESGILISITADESVTVAPTTLSLYVGNYELAASAGDRFVDEDPEEDADVTGRDLVSDPYKLFLRPVGDDMDGTRIMVAVVARAGQDVVGFGSLRAPVPFVDGKVVEWEVILSAPTDSLSQEGDCVKWQQGDRVIRIGRPGDKDCDGWSAEDDCDDKNPAINPDATEICGNQVDDNCNDLVDEETDDDMDGVTNCQGDCDDNNRAVHPEAEEVCDGLDNNCDGACDDLAEFDGDGDRFTTCGSLLRDDGTCEYDPNEPERFVDCDDENVHVHPEAEELCDGLDNDCDGSCEEEKSSDCDADGDGFTAYGSLTGQCGTADHWIDCEDGKETVHPGAPELCDGLDNDCLGGANATSVGCFVPEGDTLCLLGVRTCDESSGTPVLGDGCAGSIEAQVPMDLCSEYNECVTVVQASDPYTCALTSNQFAEEEQCVVNIDADSSLQCPGGVVALNTANEVNCTWHILGATSQGGYEIELLGAVGVPYNAQNHACNALLGVQVDPDGPGASTATFYLVKISESLDHQVVELTIGPQVVDGCPPPAGLVCDSYVAPAG